MAVKREQVVQTAEKYVARGKIEPAIREYRKLLEENPNDINTLNRVGDLYARIQRIDEAVDFFNQIAEQYAGEGFFVKAIAIYKKIIKLDPTRLDVYENLAELYHRQGLVTEARTQYQVLADYYQKHENATSTIAIYQKMAELEPNNPTYHVKLAELYQQQQLIEKAMGEYRIIAELMIAHGHPQEAAQVYERALAIDSTNIAFITDAALKLKEAAGTGITVRFLSAAVERNPQAAQVARMIGGPAGLGGTLSGISAPAAPPPPPTPAAAAEPAAAPAAPGWSPPSPPAAADRAGPAAAPPPADLGGDMDMDMDMEIELDLGADLLLDEAAAGLPPAAHHGPAALAGEAEPPGRFGLAASFDPAFEVEEDLAGPAGADAAAAAAAAGRGAQGAPDAGEADVEDVFILDIEDDAEPASLVKPPPDMLREPRRPSWAREAEPPAPPATVAPELPPLPELRLTGEFELINPFAAFEQAAADVAPPRPFLPAAGAPPPPALAPTLERPVPSPAPPPPSAELLAPLPPDFAAGAPPWPAGAAAAPPSVASGEPLAAPPPAAAAEPPAIKIDSDLLERTAAELHPPTVERYEDLVSEAEVLAKYGLEEKAIERLREALRIKPRQLAAYLVLIQLQLDKGRHARVIELANQVSRLCESGDREPWAKLRRRLLAAGYRLDGERFVAGPRLPGAVDGEGAVRSGRARTPGMPGVAGEPEARAAAGPPAGVAAPAAAAASGAAIPPQAPAGDAPLPAAAASAAAAPRRPRKTSDTGIEQMLQGLVDRQPRPGRPVKKAAPAPPAGVTPAPAAATAPPPAAALPDLSALPALPAAGATAESLAAAAAAPPAAMAAPAAAPAAPGQQPGAAAPPAAAMGPGRSDAASAAAGEAAHDLFDLPPLLAGGEETGLAAQLPPPVEIFNPLEIGAMVESEEIDWSDDGAARLGTGRAAAGAPPAIGGAASAHAGAAPGRGTAPAAGPAGAPPPGAPRPEAPGLDDTGGMSWLDEADSGKNKAAARAASLFDEEDDFFDLAGELEQELSQEPVFQGGDLLAQQEQSLEEIVEGFKRGVAEHLSPTDYDTHFNLGIAYREMGLLDEAIGEFQLSAKDARYLVSCCSMLGLCFLDKGLPELAIKWYRRGLEAEGIGEDDTLGLLYDMGCAYLAMADSAGAYKTFVEAYGINTNYRDLVARIEELGRPH